MNDTNNISYLKVISLLDSLYSYKMSQIENVTFRYCIHDFLYRL